MAKRIGIPETNLSKLMVSLRKSGIAERTPSWSYRIHPQFVVPGEQAIDLGVMVLRLDRLSPQSRNGEGQPQALGLVLGQ